MKYIMLHDVISRANTVVLRFSVNFFFFLIIIIIALVHILA